MAQLGCALCGVFLRGAKAAGGHLTHLGDRYVFADCKQSDDYFRVVLYVRRGDGQTALRANFYCISGTFEA